MLAKSSNIGTIMATGELGKTQAEANKVLYSYMRKFGLGGYSGLGFPGETKGILAPPEQWSTSQQYTIPFGQGVSINALQAASIYSTIANGGVRVEPTLVRGTKGDDGRFTPAPEPEKTRVISEKTAKTLARMLESVVDDEEGTGTKARIPATAWRARPARPTEWIRPPGSTRGTPRPSPGSPLPTSPASPSTAPSRTRRRAATSAARSAAPSTSRSWSSP